jgi:hypothetical protein
MSAQQYLELGQEVEQAVREWLSRRYPREIDEYAEFVADICAMVEDRQPEPDDGP